MATPDPFEALVDHYERAVVLGDVDAALQWDQEVVMPERGTPARSRQRAVVSGLAHELMADERVESWIEAIDREDLPQPERATVREIGRVTERHRSVPRELVERRSTASTEALEDWRAAREQEDFSVFAPRLETQIELAREYAASIDPARDPYAVLFEEYEPHLSLSSAEGILDALREGLTARIETIRDRELDIPEPFARPVDPSTQESIARTVLEDLGYDYQRGRLDTAPHPFSTGTAVDVRVTTRFDPDNPLSSLFSTVHEFGHARYTLGLPEESYGSPLGQNRGLTVHESQSRLWENHVGRSAAFWSFFTSRLAEHAPEINPGDERALYRAANRVEPGLVRVDADELTYHLHIVVRFEIERALVTGELAVEDVPEVWNDKMESLLGRRPAKPSEGALQDIHWSHGDFGYFPTYSLGSVLAAQLFEALRADQPDIDSAIASGHFDAIGDWLEEHVHRHGRRFRTDELIERATGRPLSVEPFFEYVDGKYGSLYGF